jgi:putative inorganic carbon (HCO3(-)) transporter
MEKVSHKKIRHAPAHTERKGFSVTLERIFFVEKLYNLTGIILLVLAAVIIALGISYFGAGFGAFIILAFAVAPLTYCIIVYPKFGIIILLIMAYILFVISQFGVDFPMGTLMDGLQVLLLVGMLLKIKMQKDWSIFKSPITVVILIWLAYNLVEVANPIATSRLAWVYTVRSVAVITLSYFVFMYNINSVKYIRLLFIIWLLLSVFSAAYGFKQEYIGFDAYETNYLNTPGVAGLLFIGGHWRKFSIFSDPVAFAYNMVMPSIFCICMITMRIKLWKKIVLGFMVVFFFDAMLFSGTRGANVLLPAALVLFAILKYNKKVLVFSCFAALFLLFLINVPTSNVNIVRFQTAFRPNTDESYNLRKRNQKNIQPFILTHPLGGGLGSTGEWGARFSPGAYLTAFQPDSGYMRVAVEDGWVGLIIFCTFMFVIIKTGINNYYLIENRELKTYCLALTLIVFAYNIANFPQEALVQFPSNILFYMEAALINITLRLDIKLREEKNKTLTPHYTT